MDRPSVSIRCGKISVVILALGILPAVGCQSLMLTAIYLFQGMDVDPDFAKLKEKKVVVVCRPAATLQYRNANIGRDLAQQVTDLLQKNVPKIKTVDQRKVAKWTDENTWEEYPEVGKALKAEMVVGIDVENFDLFQGQTLYQGRASITVRVYDCKDHDKVVFEKIIPESVYPPSVGIPTSDRNETDFRREFIHVLADQVARHFYEHDPNADIAQDADTLVNKSK